MEPINFSKTYKIVLNDEPKGYRPNKRALNKIKALLPECRIHGFGVYGYNDLWYVLVESNSLPYNLLGFVGTLSISQIPSRIAIQPRIDPPTAS